VIAAEQGRSGTLPHWQVAVAVMPGGYRGTLYQYQRAHMRGRAATEPAMRVGAYRP